MNVRPRVLFDVQSGDELLLRTEETESKEDELTRVELRESAIWHWQSLDIQTHLLTAHDLFHLPLTADHLPFHSDSVKTLELAFVIKHESFGGDTILSGVFPAVCFSQQMSSLEQTGR